VAQRTFAAGDDAFAAFELDAYTDVRLPPSQRLRLRRTDAERRRSRPCGQQGNAHLTVIDQVHCSISHSAELGVKTVRDASGKPAHNGKEVRAWPTGRLGVGYSPAHRCSASRAVALARHLLRDTGAFGRI
jgi:hypothetical protein